MLLQSELNDRSSHMSAEEPGIDFTTIDSVDRQRSPVGDAGFWQLGETSDPERPGFMHVRWGPDEGAPEHRHSSWTANVVLRGRLKIGDTWHAAGTVCVIEPDVWYGPLLAGPDGAEILEIHATLPGVEPLWRNPEDPTVIATEAWLDAEGSRNWDPPRQHPE